jgi:hypothetical protein
METVGRALYFSRLDEWVKSNACEALKEYKRFRQRVEKKKNLLVKELAGELAQENCAQLSNIVGSFVELGLKSSVMSDWLEWHDCGRERRSERLAEFVNSPDPAVALPALREAMRCGQD